MKSSCCKNNYKIVIGKILIAVSCFSNKVWTCQDSEYTKILNMTVLHKVWWYAWIIPEYTWMCLIMSGYVWKCKNILEYARICLNLPEWLWFYISSFSHLFYNPFPISTGGYLFERLQETTRIVWRNTRLSSLKYKICFFFHGSWKYFICFLF